MQFLAWLSTESLAYSTDQWATFDGNNVNEGVPVL